MRFTLALMMAAGLSAPAMGQLIYDNGGINPLPGGCAGGMYSEIQAPGTLFGNNTIAASFNQADDFTVPSGETWALDELVWQLYQTGSSTTEPIVSVFIQIWNTTPTTGGTPAFGDLTTNRLVSSAFSGVYRTQAGIPTDCNRAIKNAVIDMSWLPPLPAGTYWIQIASNGNPAFSGPWANHKVPRDIATDNSMFRTVATDVWAVNVDATSGQPWDYPFKLYGQIQGGGCGCVCNYDTSTGNNVCDIFDFLEFGNLFSANDPCACDLDTSTGQGVCDIFDFLGFGNLFNAGC